MSTGHWSMVRLTSTSRHACGSRPPGTSATTAVVASTPSQYAGNSRITREVKKSGTVRPQQLMQMTKPLIMKNRWTPSQPYAEGRKMTGNSCACGPSHPSPKAT